jgi:hypothetical protein
MKIALRCLTIALMLPVTAFAAPLELPTGCYSGTLDNGAISEMNLTRISSKKFRVDEYISDLGLGFPNPTGRASYTVTLIRGRNYYRGLQADNEQVSTSVFVRSTVSLRALGGGRVRYHRSLKERFGDDSYQAAQSAKGTLKRSTGSCGK